MITGMLKDAWLHSVQIVGQFMNGMNDELEEYERML
jgi:hypothetical protein